MGERSFKIDDKQQKSELDETMSIHKLWIPNEELKPDRTININVVD